MVEVFVDHGLINDCGIAFEDYKFQIRVMANDRLPDTQISKNRTKEMAARLRRELEASCATSTILIEGLQKQVISSGSGRF